MGFDQGTGPNRKSNPGQLHPKQLYYHCTIWPKRMPEGYMMDLNPCEMKKRNNGECMNKKQSSWPGQKREIRYTHCHKLRLWMTYVFGMVNQGLWERARR